MPRIPKEVCAYCKGTRKLCGANVCPILIKQSQLIKDLPIIRKREIEGTTPPNILVGEYGYPIVNMGPTSTYIQDIPVGDPQEWARKGLDLTDILKMRIAMLYSFQKRKVTSARTMDDSLKEMIISMRPVDVDVILKKEPRIMIKFDADIPPIGATGPLEKLEVVGNPLTTRKVESAVEENVKAAIIVPELWQHGFDFYYIQRLLSAGLLGVRSRRRLVPTRWSITATDMILGNYFLRKIRDARPRGEAELYYREYIGNIYYIILIPSHFWAMEMFEIWLPFSVWVRHQKKPVIIHIHEDTDGKPSNIDGGYFAIRFGILEYLQKNKRKCAAIAIRIVTPKYFAPVGSWQIRESIRLAFESGPIMRGEAEELLRYVEEKEKNLIRISLREKSWLLKRLKILTLDSFFT